MMTRSLTFRLLLLGLVVMAVPTLVAQEVGSATVVPIRITGDPASRFSLVVMEPLVKRALPSFGRSPGAPVSKTAWPLLSCVSSASPFACYHQAEAQGSPR
jgi:hypothetical protein